MGIEIERKFLADQAPLQGVTGTPIRQGYLSGLEADVEVRLRHAGHLWMLTLKRGRGLRREEVEQRLLSEMFETLWPFTEGARLVKVRHRLTLPAGMRADVDVYGGHNEGLQVVEVEFPDMVTAENFCPLSWFGPEVTDDSRYANRTLAG